MIQKKKSIKGSMRKNNRIKKKGEKKMMKKVTKMIYQISTRPMLIVKMMMLKIWITI